MLDRRWFRWTLILAFWMLLAVFFASQNAMTAAFRQRLITWRQALVFPAINYGLWALLTPLVRETMHVVERRLDPQRFLRIHRSTIVNLERVREMQPAFRGDYAVLLRDGTRLTLSRNYHEQFVRRLAGSR